MPRHLIAAALLLARCTTADPTPTPTPAAPAAPAAPAVESSSPTQAMATVSKADIVKSLTTIYWSDRLLVEWTRSTSLEQCNKAADEGRGKLADLKVRAAPGVLTEPVTQAINAMQQCLFCLDAGWFSCLDAAAPLRAIGVDIALNRETETPKISGAAREKSRKKLLASITALKKQIGKTCTGQPGEWDKTSKDKVTDLQDTAWALDPPDDTINFALDVLDGAAECTGNSEHYIYLVTRALERTAAR